MNPLPKVGDTVEFELCPSGTPRWDYGMDQGSSGVFVVGKVTNVSFSDFAIDTGTFKWSFPLPNHPTYLRDAPGFPVVVSNIPYIQKSCKTCKCDIIQIWNNKHSSGCPEAQ